MIDRKVLTDKLHEKNPAAFKYLSEHITARDNKIAGLQLFHAILQHIDLYPRPNKISEWVSVCPLCSEEWVFHFDFLRTLGYVHSANFACSQCDFRGNSVAQFYKCLSFNPIKEDKEIEFAHNNILSENIIL